MSGKNLTVNVNGQELTTSAPVPVKKGFFKEYQVLLTGLLMTAAISFHAYCCGYLTTWVNLSSQPAPPTQVIPPIEIKVVPVPAPVTPTLTPESPPWAHCFVKETSTSK